MLSRQFPKPGDRLKKVRTNDPQFHGGEVEVRVAEAERRQNHIGQIDHNQPLLLIANEDNDSERPTAQQLQERLAALKESPEYVESARPVQEILNEKDQQIREAEEIIRSLNRDIELKNELIREKNRDIESKTELIQEKDQEIVSKNEEKDQVIKSRNETIEALEVEKVQLQGDLRQQVLVVSQKDQAITEKEKAVRILQIEKTQLQTRLEAQQQAHGEEVSRRNQVISSNEEVITAKHRLIGMLRDAISIKEEEKVAHQQAHGKEISKRNQVISANKEAIAAKDRLIGELRDAISVKEEELKQTEDQQQKLLEAIRQKDKAILAMERTISEKDGQINTFDNERKLFAFNGRNTTKVCTFGRLLELLRPCSNKWYPIGFLIGLSMDELDSVIKLDDTSEQIRLEEMLKLKLRSGEELTWGDVVIALLGVREDDLAQQVVIAHQQAARSKQVDYKIQKAIIYGALQQRLKQGDTWYLVDVKWMKQWKKFVGYYQRDQNYAGLEQANPGPVDNSALFRDKNSDTIWDHMMEELDYFLLPEAAWYTMTSWYDLSRNSRPIARKVVEYGMYMKHCKIEVYLLEFKVSLHPNLNITKFRNFSRADTVGNLEAAMREEFQVKSAHECRVWHRFMTHTYELLSRSSQTLQDAGLYNGQTIVLEMRNEDGSWPREVQVREAGPI